MEGEAAERAKKYVENLERAFATLKVLRSEAKPVVDLARAYLRDAQYYAKAGDFLTSIACSSYAEGLLDALRLRGEVEFSWPRERVKRVLVGGVFDILHLGHIEFLKRARRLGRLVVVVARDSTVKSLKGREPVLPEEQRLEIIRSLCYVSEAYLGFENLDVEKTLLRVKPDIVALGPDQDSLKPLIEAAASKLGLNVEVVKVMGEKLRLSPSSTSEIIERIRRGMSRE